MAPVVCFVPAASRLAPGAGEDQDRGTTGTLEVVFFRSRAYVVRVYFLTVRGVGPALSPPILSQVVPVFRENDSVAATGVRLPREEQGSQLDRAGNSPLSKDQSGPRWTSAAGAVLGWLLSCQGQMRRMSFSFQHRK